MITQHKVGTHDEWLNERLQLLKDEKELTRRSDELARRRQELPWVRIDKEYRFDTDQGPASLGDLFRGNSQLLVYHFMFGADFKAGCPILLVDRRRIQRLCCPPRPSRCHPVRGLARADRKAAGLQEAHGLDVPMGIVVRQRV